MKTNTRLAVFLGLLAVSACSTGGDDVADSPGHVSMTCSQYGANVSAWLQDNYDGTYRMASPVILSQDSGMPYWVEGIEINAIAATEEFGDIVWYLGSVWGLSPGSNFHVDPTSYPVKQVEAKLYWHEADNSISETYCYLP